jgi:hypothetical protein
VSSRHEDLCASGGIAPSFLTSALDGDTWSASHPGCLTPGERVSRSWCQAQAGTNDQIFITVLTVTVLFFVGRPL